MSEVYLDTLQKVRVAFITDSDSSAIELIEPADANSPVNNFLKNGIAIYHLCYSVNDINQTINLMREKGFVLISQPKPAVAFNGKLIAFLFSKDKIIIELLEDKEIKN